MAVLSFKVNADYEKVVKLREEITKLENTLKSFGKNTPLAEIKAIETKLAETRTAFNAAATEAAKAGAAMGSDFKSKISAASQEVNALSSRIIEQKAVVQNVAFDVKRLGDEYRKALASGNTGKASGIKEELDAAKRALQEEKAALFGLNQEKAKASLETKKLKEEYAEFKDEADDTGGVLDNLKRKVKELAPGLVALFTVQKATEYVKEIANVRGEFQKLEIAFETMLQSKEKADALMSQIVDTAAKTPFDLQGVASGAKQLLAYGVASDKVNETLIRLGDIASGLSIPLGDLVYLYGTTMAQGRMFTMDLRQFQGRGIPMTEELAKVMGVAKNEVAGLVTAGKVGFKEMEQAIWNMTSEGGKFAGLMEKQSKTITGQISNLQDAVDQMFNEIGRSQEGVISGAIGMASNLVENYEKVGKVIGGIVTAYGSYKAAIITINALDKARTKILAAKKIAQSASVLTMQKVTTATVLWQKAQEKLNLAMLKNPYVIAAAVVAGLAVGIYALVTAKSKEERAFQKVNEEIEKYNRILDEQKQKLNELFGVLNDENATGMQKVLAVEELRNLFPAITKGLSDEQIMTLALADATKRLNEEQDRMTRSNLEAHIKETSDALARAKKEYEEFIPTDEGGFAREKYLKGRVESLQYELNNWLSQYKKIEDAAEKAKFNALPADQKIVSLKKNNDELDAQIAELDKKLAELHGKKQDAANEEPQELNVFTLGNLTGAMWNPGQSEEEVLAEMQRLQALKEQNARDIAEQQKKIDEQNKALTDKQKQAKYNRDKAEEKAGKDLEKMKRDLNYKVAQADIDSMEEGYAKTMKVLELNLKKEEDAIIQQKEDLLKRKHDDALANWLAEDTDRKAYDFKFTPTFTEDEKKMWEEMGKLANDAFTKGVKEAQDKWAKEGDFTLRQFDIDAMADGADKDKAQRDLDNEKEVHNLEMQRDAYIEAAKAAYVFAKAKETGKDPKDFLASFDATKAGKDFDAIVKRFKERLNQESLDADREAMQNYYIEYGTFKDKLLYLEQQYNDKIAKSKTEGERLSLIAERDKVLDELKKSQDAAYQNIFKDPTKMSLASVKSAIKLAREEIQKITSKGLLNEEDMENVQRLQEAIDRLQSYADSAPFAGFGDGLDGVVSKLNQIRAIKQRIADAEKTGNLKAKKAAEDELVANKEVLRKNLAGVGVDAFANGLSQAADAMARIAEISGDPQLKETADILNGTVNVISSTATGAAAGGWIGAIVGGVTAILGEVTNAAIENAAALAINEKAWEDYETNLRLMAASINEDAYDSIFGENVWAKIEHFRENIEKAKDLFKSLNEQAFETTEVFSEPVPVNTAWWADDVPLENVEEIYQTVGKVYKALGDATIKAKGSNKKQYSGTLSSIFPDIFDENGNLKLDQIDKAKEALATLQSMELKDDQGVALLDNAIQAAEKLKEAEDKLKEAAEDYMGSIGDSLGEAIVNGILRGEDALESFGEVAGGIIEQIAKDFASSWMIDNYLKNFEDDMQDAFLSGDAKDITSVVQNIVAGLPNVLEASEEATRQILDMTKGTDYDLYEKYANNEVSSQSASRKGYETLSEDTGNELVGRAVAQYESNLRMEESMRSAKESIDLMTASQIQIRDIAAESRALIADSYLELQQIRENTGAIIKPIKDINDKIDTIIKGL